MLPSSTAFPRRLRDEVQLDASECRRWVEQHHEGRLGYLSGRGPRSVVVSYTVVGDQILVQVPDYNDIAHYAPGARVTLAVDGEVEHTSAVEQVSVTGTAARRDGSVPAPGDPGRTPQFNESWPDAIKTSIVTLPLKDMEGVRRRPHLRQVDEHQTN